MAWVLKRGIDDSGWIYEVKWLACHFKNFLKTVNGGLSVVSRWLRFDGPVGKAAFPILWLKWPICVD